MRKGTLAVLIIVVLGGVIWTALQEPKEDVSELVAQGDSPFSLPAGFTVSVFAEDLVAPRVMTYDPAGHLIVSVTSEGQVVALPDRNGDGRADEKIILLDGLNRPHGLAVRCTERCEFYVAETDKVVVYDYEYDEAKKIHRPINSRKIIDLPAGSGHFTRTILFMPAPNDHKLLTSVGSSCNVCEENDWRRAKVLVSNADGSDLKEYARGLRNAVFMAIHPVSGEIWVTEMGRDYLGDNLPPDEISVIEEGGDYGWPICYGRSIHDTNFDKNQYVRDPCADKIPSHVDLQAHSAPLGLAFIPEEGWPEDWWYDLIVAYHGSWNRSEPTGYKLVRIRLDAKGNYEGMEDFMTGFLKDGAAIGRPVDVLIQPGGVMYVTDDKAGVIYKITYQGDKSDLIRVESPKPNEVIESPLKVRGEARGYWFFEASFPVKLYDESGNNIPLEPGYIMTSSEWTTTNFVPFEATLRFEESQTDTGTLILEKDNPSGLPEHDDSLSIPVRFR